MGGWGRCLVITYSSRVWVHPVRLQISCSWSAEQGKLTVPCPHSRLRIRYRKKGSVVSSRVSLLILHTQVLTYGIPPDFRGGVHLMFQTTIRHRVSPEFGRAIAYRRRSLPRVRPHSASSPQGSSSNGCCVCITMDQLVRASVIPHPPLV